MRGGECLVTNPLLDVVCWKQRPHSLLSSSSTDKYLSTIPKMKKRRGVSVSITITKAEIIIMGEEIRVCTSRTCLRQGSTRTLGILTDLAPPNVVVKSCGCLGRCGAGPNVVVLPQGIIVCHCGTASQAAQLMSGVVNATDDAIHITLDALALRKRAQAELDTANFSHAQLLLSQAIDLKPFGGIHIMYKYRSIVRLAMGNYLGALEDAREAQAIAPQYTEAYMCEGDTFMAMGQYDAAEQSYSMCLSIDPSIRCSKSFKTRVAKLKEKLITGNLPQSAI